MKKIIRTKTGGNVYKRRSKKCVSCGLLISLDAKKCTDCNSHQNFKRFFPISKSMLALLVAFVSVVSMGIPIVTKALTPDDSELTITYTRRADTTIPIIASNKGTRPAVLSSKGILKVEMLNVAGETSDFKFFMSPIVQDKEGRTWGESREGLLVQENSSKQYFFAMDFAQPIKPGFEELAKKLNEDGFETVQKCTFYSGNTTSTGKQETTQLVIFDKRAIEKSQPEDWRFMATMLEAFECIGKIPQPIRQQYGLRM